MDSIPWYKSNVLRALIMGGVAFGLKKAGLASEMPDAAASITDTALDAVQVAAGLWAAYARVKQPTPPVTLTKAGATSPPSMILLVLSALMLGAWSHADAQVVKLAGTQVLNSDGSVTPSLTWCTEQTASPGQPPGSATCTNPGPAAACTASGGWTGTKAASGTQTFPKITTTTNYFLSCTWPGQDKITATWTPPTQNDDGSALDDLAGYKIYYGTSPSMSANQVLDIKNPGQVSAVVGPGLAPGTWYLVISAYNAKGVESVKVPSPPASKTLSAGATAGQAFMVTFPNSPTNLTVK